MDHCHHGFIHPPSAQNEARKLNNKEASAEEERKKRPVNWEAKRKRSEWEEQQDQLKKVRVTEEMYNLLS